MTAGAASCGAGSLHYIDPGGDGPPVVLIHGYADSSYSWQRNLGPLLSAGLRPVLVDLPGLGRSTAPPPSREMSLGNQAAAVIALLDGLGLERAHLVGHSMGGAIVLHLCLTRPERVDRAAAIAPVWRRPRRPLMLARRGVHRLAALGGRLVFARALRDVYHDPSRIAASLVDEYAAVAARAGYWADLARLSREFFSVELDALCERLGHLEAPLLLLWGEHDTWVKPRPALAEQIPRARYLAVGDAGHNVHQEQPEAVNQALIGHLLQPRRDD